MPLFDKAVEIATKAHEGQTDKSGKPYIGHVMRVAQRCKTQKSKVIALLHDVIEDTPITPDELKAEGIPADIVEAVLTLSRRQDEPYEEYINRVAPHPLCREVKIADLEDNMDIRRLTEIGESDVIRLKKYLKAWKTLTSNISS
ncbi:MAG: HD domain-containing protein [Prevotella sp.]|nr:HD domain-containing protein [Prevotella sp.]